MFFSVFFAICNNSLKVTFLSISNDKSLFTEGNLETSVYFIFEYPANSNIKSQSKSAAYTSDFTPNALQSFLSNLPLLSASINLNHLLQSSF